MIYQLPQIIEAAAERRPDKIAFRCGDQAVSYADLVQRANRLACVLREQGVRRGDRVGIYLHKSLESAVAIYGVMQAGAAYVPLDPLLPAARLAAIVRDCGLRHLITQPEKQPRLRSLAGAGLECLIGLEADLPFRTISWEAVHRAPARPPDNGLMEQDPAYIMYTSGSTGAPKGIIHTHHSGLSYAKLAAQVYGLHSRDRLSNFPPLHFDQSTFDYFSGPLAGATTIIIPEAYTKFPASLSRLIETERLTIWYSVPFALTQLLLRGVLAERDLSSLRWVLFGGEPFPPRHLRALMKRLPQARFSNVYGPAEINQCTFYHLPSPPDDPAEPIPIGPIWPNAEGLVVDEQDRPVPEGEVGQLLVRTPTMMQGYWNRPDLNERAFFYRRSAGGRRDLFYRTGDLVRLAADGNYRFLGRQDRQIKTRGYRVELDEVEAALLTHPQIEAAAVFPGPDSDGTRQIQAAVIGKPEATVTPAELTRYLTTRLPRYAIPTRIEFRPEFPRTGSGKIDRQALQAEVEVVISNR